MPCRYSSLQDAEILKTYPQYEVVCKALEGGMYRPVIAEWTQFYTILGAEMDNIVERRQDGRSGPGRCPDSVGSSDEVSIPLTSP